MSEEEARPQPQHVPLTVLPSSEKAEQLKREAAAQQAPSSPPAAAGPAAPESHAKTPRQREIELKVLGVLRTIYDPEIPVNIYDLGLVYDLKVDETDAVTIRMTLTSPACPVAGSLPGEVEQKVEAIPEVRTANIELVWEPPWTKDRMSESAMLDLGFL